MDIKRSATTIVDAVSAEDIGKFPDKNVADALQRLPGVNTVSAAGGEGGFDENDRVSIRGTNSSLTDVQVDGHRISTGDWFILDQFGEVGRSVSFTLLPSEIVGSTAVYKSQEADFLEGGVAGLVNLVTRKPLDLKETITAEASAQAVYTTLRGKTTPDVNALFGWKDDSNRFGVIVQAFYEARDIRRDGQEFLGYTPVSATSPFGKADPSAVGAMFPNLIGSAYFLQQRVREGGDIVVQAQVSDSFEFDVEGFYSKLKASNTNNNFMFWGTNEFGNNVPTSYTIKNGAIVSATFPSAGGVPIVADSIMRPGSGSDTYYVNAHANWDITQNLNISVQGGVTRGVGKTDPQVAWEGEVQGAAGSTAGYSIDDSGIASVSMPGVDLSNGHNLVNDWAWTVVNTAVDREYYGQVDATYHTKLGPIDSIKAGARFADHVHTSTVWDGGVSYGGSLGSDISSSNYPSDFADSFKTSGMLTNVPLGNTALIEKLLFNNTSWRGYPQSPAAVSNPKNGRFDWPDSMNLQETDLAAYAMATFGGEGWKGNFGVRVVDTRENVKPFVNDATGAYSDFGRYGTIKDTHNYWDILPSANVSINLTEDQFLRFAAAETMARPDYNALGGAVSLQDLILTGSGGNPDLKPIKSANYNVSYEYYYAPQSLFAVSFFYMDLSSYVGFGTHSAVYLNQFLTGQGAAVYSTYNVTTPVNSSGHDEGVEIQWEQPIYGGFGFQSNFTYASGVDNAGGPLVGDSKVVANLTAYFENEWLSTRLTYDYRSQMLVGLDRSANEFQSPSGTLNGAVQFTVTDNLQLTFDAMNITNRKFRLTQGAGLPRAIYDNGRQFYAGIRVKL
jgi:iron complex outermembrane receptor protein